MNVQSAVIVRTLILFLLWTGQLASHATDWTQWRGPNQSNISTEAGLMDEWPPEGPPLLWELRGLGDGINSVSVMGERLYTTGFRDDGEFLWCLDAVSGEKIWARRLGPLVRDHPLMRWLTQRVPILDENRVYTLSPSGDLACRSATDGALIWKKNYHTDFGAGRHAFGYGDFPLIDNDHLICCPASETTAVVALNKQSGEVVWQTDVPGVALNGFGATLVHELAGVRQYVVKFHHLLAGISTADGRLLWRHDGSGGRTASTHTPIAQDDWVFNMNPYGRGINLFRLVPEDNGMRIALRDIYQNRNIVVNPFQDNALRMGNHLYATHRSVHPVCLEIDTGEVVWGPEMSDAAGLAGMTAADGHLYIRWGDGSVVLVEATPDEYREKGAFQIPDTVPARGTTLPVVAHQRLYIRDNDRLLCYGVAQEMISETGTAPQRQLLSLTQDERAERPELSHLISAPSSQLFDTVFVPTPRDVVNSMLDLAGVQEGEVVFDLGSGDGRIVIAAAQLHGAKGIGIEIDRQLVSQSRARVTELDLLDQVEIRHANLFEVGLESADVVVLFLPPEMLERLKPQLAALKQGARIISHQFEIPDVAPDAQWEIHSDEDNAKHQVFLWRGPIIGSRN